MARPEPNKRKIGFLVRNEQRGTEAGITVILTFWELSKRQRSPHEHESRSVLLREVFFNPPELSNAITIQRGKGQIASNCPLPYLATLCK
jgi:hypothetical protein